MVSPSYVSGALSNVNCECDLAELNEKYSVHGFAIVFVSDEQLDSPKKAKPRQATVDIANNLCFTKIPPFPIESVSYLQGL